MNFPNAPYQVFPSPIPPPPSGQTVAVCLEIDSKWIPYLLGCISQLAIERTWESDQERATGEARNLLSLFAGAKACPINVNFGVEMEDCMGCCIRWSDAGILQVLSCGEWVDVPGPGSQVSISGPSQGKNPNPPGPGQCQNFIGKVRFFGRWVLPSLVSSGDQITVNNADGITSDYVIDFPAYRCPDGTEFIISGCLNGSEVFNGSDPAPAFHHGNLIGTDGTNFYDFGQAADAMPVTITIPAGITDQNFFLLINAPGPAGDGEVSFDVQICKAQALPIGITYAFGTGPAGVSSGGIITVASTNNAGQQRFDFSLTACCKIEVLSSSGWSTVGSSGSPAYFDCASVVHNHSGADVAPEVFLASVIGLEAIANSATPFTIQVRITRN